MADNYKKIVIIGAGVAGLAFANNLIKNNTIYEITIIEKDKTIGGCHKVNRKIFNNENYFCEHGPRIYLNNYVNFICLLKQMKLNFSDLFIKYRYSFIDISNRLIFTEKIFGFYELLIITRDFLFTIFSNTYGINISMLDYMKLNNFSHETINHIDGFCRSFDGGDSSRISLNEFINSSIQSLLYSIYIPKIPNDEGLFKYWKKYLIENKVKFIIDNGVSQIIPDEKNKEIKKVILNDGKEIEGDLFIMALPPENINQIAPNAFENLITNDFVNKTKYNDYISITLHWDYDIGINKDVYGLNTKTDWGLLVMILSHYMKFKESSSKSVISCAIIYTDIKDKYLNKTANECNEKELIDAIYKQLLSVFKDLPRPTLYFINNYFDEKEKRWKSNEKAFIKVPNIDYIDFKSPIYKNLYNLGTHNGKHKNSFTSLESAITNSIKLNNIIFNKKNKIKRCFDLRDLFIVILAIIIVLLLLRYINE